MFIATLFITAKKVETTQMSLSWLWMSKMWSIYTINSIQSSAIKRNEVQIFSM